jgi:hypothetical protein
MTNSVCGGIHWKGLRGGDRNNLLQLFDRGSVATSHLTLVFLGDPFEKPDHAGGIDLRPLE